MKNEALLEVNSLHVSAGEKEILHGVDLTVGRDETHVLMGPNGTGKSTLGYAVTGDVLFATGMTGAVLSGAIFGDHCSPVSDTTVMASIFSGADHIDHVGTQVPYAATVISVIAVLYVIFGFTELSPFILLLIGVVALYFLQIILHKYSMKKYNIDPNYTKYMTEDHKK